MENRVWTGASVDVAEVAVTVLVVAEVAVAVVTETFPVVVVGADVVEGECNLLF